MVTSYIQITPLHRALLTALKNKLTPKGCAVIDGWSGEGDPFPTDSNNQVRPTAVLQMGSFVTPRRWAGLTGERYSLSEHDFAILGVAPSNLYLTTLFDLVHDALLGTVLTSDTGPVTKIGGPLNNPVSSSIHPIRFARLESYVVPVGATVIP